MNSKLTIIIGSMLACGAMAGDSPLQLSLIPNIAVFGRTERIEGLTIGVWGENPQAALALGVVNGSTGRSLGLSLAFVLNYADEYSGMQWAAVNYAGADFLGWQLGAVNYADGPMKGLQTGFVNYAGHLTGLQFGFVNFAETTETGVQIGLVNFIPRNAWFSGLPDELAPVMVVLNWRL